MNTNSSTQVVSVGNHQEVRPETSCSRTTKGGEIIKFCKDNALKRFDEKYLQILNCCADSGNFLF